VLAPALAPSGLPRAATYEAPDRFARHEMGARVWHAVAPPPGDALPPTVVLLHGSNRDGRAMLDMWEEVAAREGLLLIAPDSADPRGWTMATDGPAFLGDVLDAAHAAHPFDRSRVYLYGHSAGAIFALRLAAGGPGPWRAVAVHAGDVDPRLVRPHADAAPLRIQVGDRDALFPLDEVRASARALALAGHAVTLVVVPGHDHWLYAAGPRLAADAWAFFADG
jgi:poly(3-hydroxybutyrate) depolymerase